MGIKLNNIKKLQKIKFTDKIYIPSFFSFKKISFLYAQDKYIKKIFLLLKKRNLILRSSAVGEDKKNFSLAGKYDSLILNKRELKNINLKQKILNYVHHFDKPNDEIIIQDFISNVDLAGVIFTKDINNNSPYISINYDKSGKTHLITSGAKSSLIRNLFIFRDYKFSKNNIFRKLIRIIFEIEKKFSNSRLDIEFAIKKKKIFIFQVRELPNTLIKIKKSYNLTEVLTNIKKKLNKLINEKKLFGKKTYFSNMSDWNPAEMIGQKPSRLALSLYKEFITNDIWAIQRKDYGYKDVNPNQLLFSFSGTPYIDLRTDFSSFLPKDLNLKIANKVIDHSLNIIQKKPYLHNRIEFDVINTCYSIDTKDKLKFLTNSEKKTYQKSLIKLTNSIILNGYLKREKIKITMLSKNLSELKKLRISPIQKMFYLNNIGKKYGSLPFAGIARIAFICSKILKDLKNYNFISSDEYKNFYLNCKSLNKDMQKNYQLFIKKKISKKDFLKIYGHLRPSTYDINSFNYSENFSNYFKKTKVNIIYKKQNSNFQNQLKIEKLFKKLGFKFSFRYFIKLAKDAIYQRELAKFRYSKVIDEIFTQIMILSKELSIKRKDLAFIDYDLLIKAYSDLDADKLKNILKNNIRLNKKLKNTTDLIKLPDVLFNDKVIYSFEVKSENGNYITREKCSGTPIEFYVNCKSIKQLENKIVFIENADPGYDFLFNYKIKGLVTKYGGANSHMAIRCLELNLPSIIGIGAKKFDYYKKNDHIFIDCKNKLIEILN